MQPAGQKAKLLAGLGLLGTLRQQEGQGAPVVSRTRLNTSPCCLQAGAVLTLSDASRGSGAGQGPWAAVLGRGQPWPRAWARQRYPVTGYPCSQEELILHLSGFFPFTGSSDRAHFEPGNIC